MVTRVHDDAQDLESPAEKGARPLSPTVVLIVVFGLLATLPFLFRPSVPPLTSAVLLDPDTSDPALLQRTVQVLQRRLDNERIPGRVEIADAQIRVALGAEDLERAKPFLLKRRVLQFLLVHETAETEVVLLRMQAEPDPEKRDYLAGKDPLTQQPVLLERQGGLGPELFEDFYPAMDNAGKPCIGFKMSLAGGRVLYDLTSQNQGRKLAIVLDGEVLSVPTIRAAIRSRGIIEPARAGWSAEELRILLSSLRSGALPVEVRFVRQEVTSHE
jgi:preprotein translocase subunit SecD